MKVVSTILAFSLLVAPAYADSQQEGGKAHFLAGVEQFKQRHFLQALSEFEGSYKLNPVAGVLFNIALTQKELGRNRDALATFDRYVSAAGANMNVAQRNELDKQIAVTQAKLAMLKLEIPIEAQVKIDGQPYAPPYDRIALDPGTHGIEVSAAAHATDTRQAVLREGTHTVLSIQLPPVTAPAVAAAPDAAPQPVTTVPVTATQETQATRATAYDFVHSGRGGAAIAFGTLSLLSFVIEAGTGGASLADKHTYDRGCGAGVCSAGTYDAGHRLAVASDVFLGIGLTTAAISTLIIVTRPKYVYHADSRVSVGPTGVGVRF